MLKLIITIEEWLPFADRILVSFEKLAKSYGPKCSFGGDYEDIIIL
jgi:hypothetical protein